MTMQLAPGNGSAIMDDVIAKGDLSKLTPEQRARYYAEVCGSMNLNPLTQPFEYITLNGKLTLYARRTAADQLRRIHGVNITVKDRSVVNDVLIVTVEASDRDGRTDTDIGAVAVGGLKGEAYANAIMKAITKAKRRVTLSMCGLGWLDETEVESVPNAQPVTVDVQTGEILNQEPPAASWEAAQRLIEESEISVGSADPASWAAEPEPATIASPAHPAATATPRGNPGRYAGLHRDIADAFGRNNAGVDVPTNSHQVAHDLAAAKYGVGSLTKLDDAQLGELRHAIQGFDAPTLKAAWDRAIAILMRRAVELPQMPEPGEDKPDHERWTR